MSTNEDKIVSGVVELEQRLNEDFGVTQFGSQEKAGAMYDAMSNFDWSTGTWDNPQINSGDAYSGQTQVTPDTMNAWRDTQWNENPTGLNMHGEELPVFAEQWDYYGNPYYGEGIGGWFKKLGSIWGESFQQIAAGGEVTRQQNEEAQTIIDTANKSRPGLENEVKEADSFGEWWKAAGDLFKNDLSLVSAFWKSAKAGAVVDESDSAFKTGVVKMAAVAPNLIDASVRTLLESVLDPVTQIAQQAIGTLTMEVQRLEYKWIYDRALEKGIDSLPGWAQDEAAFMLAGDDANVYWSGRGFGDIVADLAGLTPTLFGGEASVKERKQTWVKGGADMSYLESDTPWLDSWKASKMFYSTAVSDYTLQNELYRRIQAGENPTFVAQSLEKPWAQGIFELLIDPLEILLWGVGKTGTTSSKLINMRDYGKAVPELEDAAKAMLAVENVTDAQKMTAIDDMAEGLMRIADEGLATKQARGSKHSLLFGDGPTGSLRGWSDEGLRAVAEETTYTSLIGFMHSIDKAGMGPDEYGDFLSTLQQAYSGDRVQTLNAIDNLSNVPHHQLILSPAAADIGAYLNAIDDPLKILDDFAGAGTLEEVLEISQKWTDAGIRKVFPTVEESIAAGVHVPAYVQIGKKAVEKTRNIVGPAQKFFAYMHMGFNPGFLVRNFMSNTVLTIMDMGPGALKSMVLRNTRKIDDLKALGISTELKATFTGITKSLEGESAIARAMEKTFSKVPDLRGLNQKIEEFGSLTVVHRYVTESKAKAWVEGFVIPETKMMVDGGVMTQRQAEILINTVKNSTGDIDNIMKVFSEASELGHYEVYRNIENWADPKFMDLMNKGQLPAGEVRDILATAENLEDAQKRLQPIIDDFNDTIRAGKKEHPAPQAEWHGGEDLQAMDRSGMLDEPSQLQFNNEIASNTEANHAYGNAVKNAYEEAYTAINQIPDPAVRQQALDALNALKKRQSANGERLFEQIMAPDLASSSWARQDDYAKMIDMTQTHYFKAPADFPGRTMTTKRANYVKKVYGTPENAWKAWGIAGDPPNGLTTKELYRQMWEPYHPTQREHWRLFRDRNQAVAGNFMDELKGTLDEFNIPTDQFDRMPEMVKADKAYMDAVMWENGIINADGIGETRIASNMPDQEKISRMANAYGVETAKKAAGSDVPIPTDHLLNIMNKHASGGYLDETVEAVAKSVDNQAVARTTLEAAEVPATQIDEFLAVKEKKMTFFVDTVDNSFVEDAGDVFKFEPEVLETSVIDRRSLSVDDLPDDAKASAENLAALTSAPQETNTIRDLVSKIEPEEWDVQLTTAFEDLKTKKFSSMTIDGEAVQFIGGGGNRMVGRLPDGTVIKFAPGDVAGLQETATWANASDELKSVLAEPLSHGAFVDQKGTRYYYQTFEELETQKALSQFQTGVTEVGGVSNFSLESPLFDDVRNSVSDVQKALRKELSGTVSELRGKQDIKDAIVNAQAEIENITKQLDDLVARGGESASEQAFAADIQKMNDELETLLKKDISTPEDIAILQAQMKELQVQLRPSRAEALKTAVPESEAAKKLQAFSDTIGEHLGRGDLHRADNIGVTKDGRIVSIDYKNFTQNDIPANIRNSAEDLRNNIAKMPEGIAAAETERLVTHIQDGGSLDEFVFSEIATEAIERETVFNVGAEFPSAADVKPFEDVGDVIKTRDAELAEKVAALPENRQLLFGIGSGETKIADLTDDQILTILRENADNKFPVQITVKAKFEKPVRGLDKFEDLSPALQEAAKRRQAKNLAEGKTPKVFEKPEAVELPSIEIREATAVQQFKEMSPDDIDYIKGKYVDEVKLEGTVRLDVSIDEAQRAQTRAELTESDLFKELQAKLDDAKPVETDVQKFESMDDVTPEMVEEALNARALSNGDPIPQLADDVIGAKKELSPKYDGRAPTTPFAMAQSEDELTSIISKFEDSLEKQWGKVEPFDPLSGDADQMKAWGDEFVSRRDSWSISTAQEANHMRDFILSGYDKTMNGDGMLALLFPYHKWYTTQYASWLQRITKNPQMIRKYAVYKNKMAEARADQPEWMRQQVAFDMFGMWDNPLFFNLEATLNPANSLTTADFNDPKRRVDWISRTLDNLGKTGPSVSPILTTMLTYALHERGKKEKNEEYMDAAARWAGRLTPATQFIKSVTSKAGIGDPGGVELDPFVNFFSDGFTPYERNRIGNQAGALIQENPDKAAEINEDFRNKEGDWWDQAIERAANNRDVGNIASFLLGVGFKGRTIEDAQVEKALSEWYRFWAFSNGGDYNADQTREGMAMLMQKYPFLEATLMARKGGIERDVAYAWNVLNRIPPNVDSDELLGLTQEQINKFYESKGHIENWTEADRERFMASILDLGAMLEVPTDATRQEWDEVDSRKSELKDQQKVLFGKFIDEGIAVYYGLKRLDPESGLLFLESQPEIEDALKWMTEQQQNDPLIQQYLGAQKIESYYTSQMYDDIEEQLGNGVFEVMDTYWTLRDRDEKAAKDYRRKNSKEIKAYYDLYFEWQKEIARQTILFADSIPQQNVPELRDVEPESIGQQDVLENIEQAQQVISIDVWEQAIGENTIFNQAMDFLVDGREIDPFAREELDKVAVSLGMTTDQLLELMRKSLP